MATAAAVPAAAQNQPRRLPRLAAPAMADRFYVEPTDPTLPAPQGMDLAAIDAWIVARADQRIQAAMPGIVAAVKAALATAAQADAQSVSQFQDAGSIQPGDGVMVRRGQGQQTQIVVATTAEIAAAVKGA